MASLLLSFLPDLSSPKSSHTMEMLPRTGWRIETWLLTPTLYQPYW
ncbi:unnamed protein product [Arabidopsis lyrata]|uniref:Uncharacterized protein n=1 Tax=Arabidopsis thaliana x Arabidopsis arenosa TaxID=1240361 RepID=A0A8T2A9T3_9BRAS|nr:hypothetical protein ISN45_Aa04g018730 [Arabidopsis thaliana x Arabidopsis arenosa]CAH8264697.1 unnamed protein product [Arabidopsis lyrata]